MTRFLLFVHVIAAMVYFGLPMTFGRWFRGGLASGGRITGHSVLGKMALLAGLHLNIAGAVALLTGVWLTTNLGYWGTVNWPYLALVLVVLSLANTNLLLLPAVRAARDGLVQPGASIFDATKLNRRISLFSALHHSLVTLLTALMIFQPL